MSSRLICIVCAGALLVCVSVARPDEKPALETDSDNVPGTTVPIELVRLPAGKVTLSDKDGKEVAYEIKPVWIGKTEVTWDQYYPFHYKLDVPQAERAKVDAKSRPTSPQGNAHGEWGPEGFPAFRIHHLAAQLYCDWLTKKTGKKYRLATEAEWEYACRTGGAALAPKVAEMKEVAWTLNDSEQQPHEVGKKKPNAWGLYDMLGNVAEWVVGADGVPVVKGGSHLDDAEEVSSSLRRPFDPEWQKDDCQTPKARSWLSNGQHIGFRLVREE